MTAQEAKQRLEKIWKDYTSAYDTVSIEDIMAFDMATNALGAIEQIQWERDLAIKQLHDLGYGLGEKPREGVTTNTISRQEAIDAVSRGCKEFRGIFAECEKNLNELPSVQPDNHEVACLLAELFDDTCACNFNGIDEWLPDKCEFLDACPDPGGVICWEQFLKYRAERRTDE